MKLRTIAGIAVLAFALLVPAGFAQQLARFTSQDQTFSIMLPQQPTVTVESKTTVSGEAYTESDYSATDKTDGLTIDLIEGTYASNETRSPSDILSAFVEKTGATVAGTYDLSVSGNPGAEAIVTIGDTRALYLVTVKGNHLFQLLIATPVTSATADQFQTVKDIYSSLTIN